MVTAQNSLQKFYLFIGFEVHIALKDSKDNSKGEGGITELHKTCAMPGGIVSSIDQAARVVYDICRRLAK